MSVARRPFSMSTHLLVRNSVVCGIVLGLSGVARAQAPAPEPPPLWETQVGASFVGTSGNTETTTVGADFSQIRRWRVWQIESGAAAIRTTDHDIRTAERYLAAIRGKRQLTRLLGLSGGERVERDRLAGMDFRSILDGGLSWALVRSPRWTLDGLTALGWNHEKLSGGPKRDHPVGVFQALSGIPFGAAASTTQRFTYYPDFKESSAYRSEAEVTAQAAMNGRLALKMGYLFRYSNLPVPGFKKSDNTTTASLVLRFKAATPAP
jgi:putative salt-induced outer membrane protein